MEHWTFLHCVSIHDCSCGIAGSKDKHKSKTFKYRAISATVGIAETEIQAEAQAKGRKSSMVSGRCHSWVLRRCHTGGECDQTAHCWEWHTWHKEVKRTTGPCFTFQVLIVAALCPEFSAVWIQCLRGRAGKLPLIPWVPGHQLQFTLPSSAQLLPGRGSHSGTRSQQAQPSGPKEVPSTPLSHSCCSCNRTFKNN